jgi:hypothetical protein
MFMHLSLQFIFQEMYWIIMLLEQKIYAHTKMETLLR